MTNKNKSASVSSFKRRLKEFGYSSYAEYLRSDHWADVKRRYKASKLQKQGECAGCGASGPFELHHRTYKRIGAEWLSDLVLVCRPCHEKIHRGEMDSNRGLLAITKSLTRTHMRKVRREQRAAQSERDKRAHAARMAKRMKSAKQEAAM